MNKQNNLTDQIILVACRDEHLQNLLIPAVVHGLSPNHQISIHTSAASAIEAAHNFEKAGRSPNICIASCALPDSTGANLLQELRRISPRIATLLIAEQPEAQDAIQAIKDEHADRWIDSSATIDTLIHHVTALSNHNHRLEQLHEKLRHYPANHLFVTGATGFLGARFIRDVLRCTDMKVTALTRGRRDVPYDERLPCSVNDFAGRLRFVEGDVRLMDLGISERARKSLKESVDEVWHLAALTTFDEVLRDAVFAVNLRGTENVVVFAKCLPGLNCFNHVSTAYVCGDAEWPDLVPERIVDHPNAFKNSYEESKYEAEKHVVNSGLPHLIYRPSIILGETVSGRSDGQTVYNIAKVARLAKLLGEKHCDDRGIRVVADIKSRKNLIPVDDVTSMMLRVRAANPESGTVFNITNPKPANIGGLVEAIAALLQTNKYEIVNSFEGDDLSGPEKVLDRVTRVFRPYMVTSDPIFDMTNTRNALGHLEIPPIDEAHLRFILHAFYTQFFGTDYNTVAARPRQHQKVSAR